MNEFQHTSTEKKLCVNITKLGEHWDEEENFSVISGLEKDFIKSFGLVKCNKNKATHYVIVCDSISPNGCIKGLKFKQWMNKFV